MRAVQLRGVTCAVVTAVVGVMAVSPGSASAARVLRVGRNGRVTAGNDRFLPGEGATDAPALRPGLRRTRAARAHTTATPVAVPAVLQALLSSGQMSQADYTTDLRIWNKGVAAEPTLTGTPAAEFDGVMGTAQTLADDGLMTASRAPEIFQTLWRNRVWWTTNVVPSSGQRIEFSGSQIVWEYYPGQGIQLQVLGTFGKADGLYTAGAADYGQMLSLVNEMIPLAADRNGALTWEYLFSFENGTAPWTSAMSQGTAIEALTRASWASTDQGNPSAAAHYLSVAHQALAILTQAPPQGVAVPTVLGTRFVLYSFNPGEKVINGFLQTLIGLYDYAHASGDSQALALFNAGNGEAQAELPAYDTGAWSLYEPGQEDTLDYHQLVLGFLQSLCQRTGATVYCTTAQHFQADLTTPPKVSLLTTSAPAGTTAVRFSLSKISNVTVTITHGTQTVATRTAQYAYGTDTVTVPPLGAGTYTVRLTATDLAGNIGQSTGALATG